MYVTAYRLLLVCVVAYHLLAIGLFMSGFFPIETSTEGYATLARSPSEPYRPAYCDEFWCGGNYTIPPKFGRLIVVVIDALRADYILSDKPRMKFVDELIKSGQARAFAARAHTPTVTTPKIKSITSGSIPGFSDFFGNMAPQAMVDDNILFQFLRAKWNITFFGDSTWLKLFPKHFIRHEGVFSQFVSDFYEVDNNVTRHVRPELHRNDWQMMVLHYVGLDHIGHTARPSSPLVTPKLNEMDQVIKLIYQTITEQDEKRKLPTLVVLCGDYGMSDTGSHGGSSYKEVMTPFVFMSSTFTQRSLLSLISGGKRYKRPFPRSTPTQINQIDFVSTASTLFGIPIPKNNLGVVVKDVLAIGNQNDLQSVRYTLRALQLNADQLMTIFEKNNGKASVLRQYQHIRGSHATWLKDYHQLNGLSSHHLIIKAQHIAKSYMNLLHSASEKLVTSLFNYDLYTMIVSNILQVEVYVVLLYVFIRQEAFTCFHFTVDVDTSTIVPLRLLVCICSFLYLSLHLALCTGTNFRKSALCSTSGISPIIVFAIIIAFGYGTANVLSSVTKLKWLVQKLITLFGTFSKFDTAFQFLFVGILLHTFTLFSSSFIEEEHQTWFYLCPTFFFLLSLSLLKEYFQATRWGQEVIKLDYRSTNQQSRKRIHMTTDDLYSSRHISSMTSESYAFGVQETRSHHVNFKGIDEQLKSTSAVLNKQRTDMTVSIWHAKKEIVCVFCILSCNRIIRSWNQTGDKWAYLPDIGDWLNLQENKAIVSVTSALSLMSIYFLRCRCHTRLARVLLACGLYCSYAYRGALAVVITPFPSSIMGILEARLTYICAILLICCTALTSKRKETLMESVSSALLLICVLLSRPHNTTVIALVLLQLCLLTDFVWPRIPAPPMLIACAHYVIGQACYFSLGNSNSLATVDVSAGYVGLTQHNSIALILLTCISTYTGQLIGAVTFITYILREGQANKYLLQYCGCILLMRSQTVSLYSLVVTVLRYHPFSLSVFSPKLIYEGITSILFCFLLVIILLSIRRLDKYSSSGSWRISNQDVITS